MSRKRWTNHFWIDRPDLSGSGLVCVLALARVADAGGACRIGFRELAARVRVGKRQLQSIVRELELKNAVRVARGDGKGHLSEFELIRSAPVRPQLAPEKVAGAADKGEPEHTITPVANGEADRTDSPNGGEPYRRPKPGSPEELAEYLRFALERHRKEKEIAATKNWWEVDFTSTGWD